MIDDASLDYFPLLSSNNRYDDVVCKETRLFPQETVTLSLKVTGPQLMFDTEPSPLGFRHICDRIPGLWLVLDTES